MKILSFETANRFCSAAFAIDGKLVDYQEASALSQQSEELFTLVKKVLGFHQLRDVDVVATNIGPGSFTGVRIGIAAANGLKIALPHLRLCGLTTLELLSCYATQSQYITIMPAGQGDFYCQINTQDILCLSEEELGQLLLRHPNHQIIRLDQAPQLSAKTILQRIFLHHYSDKCVENLAPLYIKPPHITTSSK